MTGWLAETISIALLVACLGVVATRPGGVLAGFVAVPAAALTVITGIVPSRAAWHTLRELGPTVGFLAAILVLGHLAAEAGVFTYLGAVSARLSGGRPRRLLLLVVVLAALVTAVLTLDATVVLLTPVVVQTARNLRAAPRPHAYACTQLANSGSLLLPVSNLTNLLAFAAAGVSFGRFTALMALPWLAASALEWLGLRLFFRSDLPASSHPVDPPPPAPRYSLVVIALTVAGFAGTSAVDVPPVWAALAGVVLLGVPRVLRRETTLPRMVIEASPGFVAFVFALGIVVDGVARHGLGTALRHVLPHGSALPALLAIAVVAAVVANLLNNLPATLVLTPLVAANPIAVLAVLIGVNVGPNLTYIGSLATLLWRRLLPDELRPRAREFHLYGALSVPVILAVTTVLLWTSARLIGV
ncbi:MAG: SLC13 family permease [Jatrophihabitans sp.]